MADLAEIDLSRVPEHVAIIMDGNGRWAQKKGLLRTLGHKTGVDSVREIVKCGKEFGVKILTLYAFSTENWKRPSSEVSTLMSLLKTFLQKEFSNIHDKNIKLQCIGQQDKLPTDVQEVLQNVISKTANNDGMVLNLALSYGARTEIISGIKKLVNECVKGETSIDDISEDNFHNYLYTKDLKDPDLMIRTGGESRLSNFLLWQVSYSELYFVDTYWPNFRRNEFIEAIKEYQSRQRRFGKTGDQVTSKK